MVEMLDYSPKVNEFELQSRSYIQIRTYTPEKVIEPLFIPKLCVLTTVLQSWLWH